MKLLENWIKGTLDNAKSDDAATILIFIFYLIGVFVLIGTLVLAFNVSSWVGGAWIIFLFVTTIRLCLK